MQLYVGVVKDRHMDPQLAVFSEQEEAIAWAEKQAADNSRSGRIEPGLSPDMVRAGYIYYATYSVEGDSVWVEKKTLDSEVR